MIMNIRILSLLCVLCLSITASYGITHIPNNADTKKNDRLVGVFYYIWLGSHGHDHHFNPSADAENGQGVVPVTDKDTQSPYVISDIIQAPLGERQWGPKEAFHHWGEPLFDYYVSNDRWVMRKHILMFVDAHVDVVVFDTTNGFHYRDNYMVFLEELDQLKKQGLNVPKVAFNTGTLLYQSGRSVEGVYRDLYSTGKYKDHWFMWRGKPLIMANPESIKDDATRDFFTIRYSWAWTRFSDPVHDWFKDGKDKWPWLDNSPQQYGWHESPDIPEMMPVACAEHPHSNRGKSRSNGQPMMPPSSSEALYFQQQWDHAIEVNPQFVILTQWNEWIAQRAENNGGPDFYDYAGRPSKKGDPIFIDVFDMEYNRDLEPMRGGYGDIYYYSMVDNIRTFKGIEAPATVHKPLTISKWSDWDKATAVFTDHANDTIDRDHFGWGSTGPLIDTTGRNDIVGAKITADDQFLYVMAETKDKLSPRAGENWMELFIKRNDYYNPTTWEGYQFRLSLDPVLKDVYHLYQSIGGWHWRGISTVQFAEQDNKIMVKIPLTDLGYTKGNKYFDLEFKWSDNRQTTDIIDFLSHGDVAPNARFNYHFNQYK